MIDSVARIALGALVIAACAGFVVWLWPDYLANPSEAGEEGRRRKEALAHNVWFRLVEPLIVALSQKIALVPVPQCRSKIEDWLKNAGRPLGLSVDEFLACVVLSGVGYAVGGLVLAGLVGWGGGAWVTVGAILGVASPFMKVQSFTRQRGLDVGRSLPQVIDLIALAMEAGLDFHGAITQVISRMGARDPLRFELEHILDKLIIGRSRRAALEEFASRVPMKPVRQFTSAVIQAEKRGTPLAQVLSVQAEIMRTRRSEAVEQAASRAAILIFGPLMLIFASIFLILLGPFVIKIIRGELF